MVHPEIRYEIIQPGSSLADFVESFWMLENPSEQQKEIVVLPDGRFDIIFSCKQNGAINIMQMGLGTEPDKNPLLPKTRMFAISFKLLAIEYLLHIKAASLLNKPHRLPADFWGITKNDLYEFDTFVKKVSATMRTLIKEDIDNRKQELFRLIYASNGSLTVKELSEKVYWSSRQINRYFNEQFGISLKAYCNILRFRASLSHIKKGKLFPELNFTDQSHFIKEIRKFSGVAPKELSLNENGRFILLSTLPLK